jgi:hypothetical protein
MFPPDPLYPNDATAFDQGHTDDLTSQVTYVYTISPTVLNEFRLGGSRELDKYKPPSLDKNDPATLGLEPAYGTNAPANVFPKVSIDSGAGVGGMGLGAGNGQNGNIDAVLGEGVYNVSDVLYADSRQAHHQGWRRVRQGLPELYELGRYHLGKFRIQWRRHRNPVRRLSGRRRLWMVRLRIRRHQRAHVEFGVVRQRRHQGYTAPDAEPGPALADAVRLGRESQPVRQLRPESA